MIEWGQTPEGDQWARYQGRLLCSARDPKKEARQWVENSILAGDFSYVDVVGIGLGYHLFELFEKFPHLKIRAFDTKKVNYTQFPHALRQQFEKVAHQVRFLYGDVATAEAKKQIPLGPVLNFRSACGENDMEVYQTLLGQGPAEFLSMAEANGFDLRLTIENLPRNLAVNLKTISAEKLSPQQPEAKLLQVLRELVQ